jgi:hypothetical protein
MVSGNPVKDAADHPVLGGHDVAVDQHHRRTLAGLKIVKPDAIDGNEPAARGMVTLDLAGPVGVVESGGRKGRSRGGKYLPGTRHLRNSGCGRSDF